MSDTFLPGPPYVARLRTLIQEARSELFLLGYLDVSTGEYFRYPVDPGTYSSLWTLWRSNLGQYAPPVEPTVRTSEDAHRALDALLRRLEDLFGPDPDPRNTFQGVPIEDGAEGPTTPAPTRAHPDPVPTTEPDDAPTLVLLRVVTNGLSDDRFKDAAAVLSDRTLNTHQKLTKVDALIPIPPTTSAQQLAAMLGVTKQAVLKTAWWVQHRKGERDDEIGRRRASHKTRAKNYDESASDADAEDR